MLCLLFVLYDMSANLMLHQKLPPGLLINFEIEIIPHSDVDMCVCVWGGGRLNFYKEYLFVV